MTRTTTKTIGKSVSWTRYAQLWADTCPRGTNPPKDGTEVRALYDSEDWDDFTLIGDFMRRFSDQRRLELTDESIDQWLEAFLAAMSREVSR